MRGRAPKRHNCGEHGTLTVREISAAAGICETAIYQRLQRGITGADLVLPDGPRYRTGGSFRDDIFAPPDGNGAIFVALRMIRAFGDRTPSIEALRKQFGLSRATAYRWRNSWLSAHGVDA